MPFYVTNQPTGLAVTRNGSSFTFTWKIGDKDYGRGQQIAYKLWTNNTPSYSWESADSNYFAPSDRYSYSEKYWFDGADGRVIGGTVTSKTISINMDAFYPKTNVYFYKIKFYVRGHRGDFTENDVKYTASGNFPSLSPSNWSSIEWTAKAPNDPKSLSASLTAYNQTNFSWEFNADSAMNAWFTKYEWESILLRNSTITDGSKVYFNANDNTYLSGSGTSFNAGNKYVTENSSSWVESTSYTRWFRIRTIGPKGASKWYHAKHIYSVPYAATSLSGKLTLEQASMLFLVKWNLNVPADHPADTITAQYCVALPSQVTSTSLIPPDDGWTDSPAGEIKDTSSVDGVTFRVPVLPEGEQCVWARIVTTHDTYVKYSSALLLRTGVLNAPSNLSVTVNSATHMATVEATDNSDFPNSCIIVKYFDKTANYQNGFDIAQIPHGENSVTFQCPNWGSHSIYFQVYAVSPRSITSSPLKNVSGVNVLSVSAHARSETVTQGGMVPTIPTNITLSTTDIKGTIRVTWRWAEINWEYVELSWADHEDAWESTSGPSTYTLNRIEAPSWNISGLSTDKTWYVRLRFGDVPSDGNSTVWGAYSTPKTIDLSVSPEPPVLHLSEGVTTVDGTVKASWTYFSEDGTPQQAADIYLYTLQNNTPSYELLYHLTSSQTQVITPSSLGWLTGNTYQMVLRVTSTGGKISEWSEPVSLSIADPVTITISEDSFVRDVEIVADEEKDLTRTITALTEMPLTIRILGSGHDGTTSVTIVRLDNYYVNRPDEDEFNGYAGETIASISQVGEELITVRREDLIGHLDDGARYRLTATVVDRYGQAASEFIDFEVYWDHQAMIPEATAVIDSTYEVAMLSPIAPDGAIDTDVCDIYRLSADKPELVYESAKFGSIYVDPYPTIGDYGGYRFVYKTANGDYVTADDKMAWIDIYTNYRRIDQIIDFGDYNVNLKYNVDLSNNWSKDFKETKYLGGSIQGDWNAAISRSSTINGVVVTETDQDMIKSFRRLAVYPGSCRVRTIDGSNYEANVQVTENRGHEPTDLVTSFSINVTRVDAATPAGLSYEEWATFIENAVRTISAFYTEDGNMIVYTIKFTVYSTNTQMFLHVLSITAEGEIDGIATSAIYLTIDGDAESLSPDISGEVPLSISKIWNKGTAVQDKQICLEAIFSDGTDTISDKKYTYVTVSALDNG